MENTLIRPSSNGYDFLESYLTALYGERGTFRHNLQRYLSGKEFLNSCRAPTCIDDIPELTFETIRAQVVREAHFCNRCDHALAVYAKRQQEQKLTKDDYYEIAGIMGLCPGQYDWHETLFPHLVDLFVSSEKEGNEIWKSVEKQPNIIEVMVSVMSNGLRSGQIIDYYNRHLWSQGYARNYFRGENAYNAHSRPSLFRNLSGDPCKARLQKVIGNLQMIEFAIWLNGISFVQKWPYGDVFHGAIAQHYGIPTNGLDMTSDLKTALFFACCQYDSEKRKWRPLQQEEYKHADLRPAVKARGGDARYGIIFSAPVDVANMSRIANISDLRVTGVTPIGFQPFMRCSSQYGYIIEAGEPYDLYKDPSFSKHKFRHSPEICNWIFSEMDEGRHVYPQEMFGTCEDIVDTLKEQTLFSQQAYSMTLEHLKLEQYAVQIQAELEKQGVQIVSSVRLCTEDRRQELEQSYWNAYNNHIYSATSPSINIQFSI